jgi:hypothetical protein
MVVGFTTTCAVIFRVRFRQISLYQYIIDGFVVFNATFNNISVISWRSVLLMEETGENHWPVASH